MTSRRETTLGSCVTSICQTVDILDCEDGRAGPWTEYGRAAFEAHIGLGDTSEQGFYELVHLLARLARHMNESGFQGCVQGDGGRWHR